MKTSKNWQRDNRVRILGIDPGLERTGWGVIESEGSRLTFLAAGVILSKPTESMATRLNRIDTELSKIVQQWHPQIAAIEETFVNKNAASSLKLGQARGVAIVAPARSGLEVAEYSANTVKKTVVGVGHAGKDQIGMMIKVLLPKAGELTADAADALAVAICHAHHAQSPQYKAG
ncbi:MAG TPA: crossover junction endodeoxyribonuclease RuvC [Alphaproteobacteria bacterium]|nr:crossover junction endodeoxyribonuclease RuvC [Alphaproteobacteria bacterium]